MTFGYATAFIVKKIKELTKLQKLYICDLILTALPYSPASKFIEDPAQSINDFLKYSQAAQLQTLTGLQRECQINSCFVSFSAAPKTSIRSQGLEIPSHRKACRQGPDSPRT